mmetsp:Transcript_5316/g.7431  ORF Transcript_5316/g.7431 Transcript_5316/m.7431 type:complete len:106 (+) Transcript_5316:202-519(+)
MVDHLSAVSKLVIDTEVDKIATNLLVPYNEKMKRLEAKLAQEKREREEKEKQDRLAKKRAKEARAEAEAAARASKDAADVTKETGSEAGQDSKPTAEGDGDKEKA